MKTIGIKLADGSFYPVLEDNTPSEKNLELTTAHNNQTKIMVDLYRSASCSMEDAEYVDSLQIENLVARPNGEPSIAFTISIDEDNQLSARIVDEETGNASKTTITLVSRTLEERLVTDEYDISGAAAVAAGAAATSGLLAAASALRSEESDDETVETSDDTIVEEPAESNTIGEETAITDETEISEESDSLPDMDFDLPDEPLDEPESPVDEPESPVVEPIETTETTESTDDLEISNEPVFSDDNTEISEDSGSLPDMDFDLPDDTTETTDDTEISDDTVISDDSDALPDMDFDLPDDTTSTEEEQPEMPDDFFNMEDTTMNNSTFDDETPASAGLNFDGLYDEETERGTPAETEEYDVKKKTKVPVIICIICAIICIIATLLILFIIPSKYNLITKKHAKDAGTTVAIEQPEPVPVPEEQPEPEPAPAVPEAKEDEIVIIEKAEKVVPKQPPVAEKPKNITYKIKWGDTLWDIADTYYKNPWRYKYIARYNGIKNPDHIISGTIITIPAE